MATIRTRIIPQQMPRLRSADPLPWESPALLVSCLVAHLKLFQDGTKLVVNELRSLVGADHFSLAIADASDSQFNFSW